ncbi:MAG: carbohydrate ABC transporter permease [Lachnospiraceae bacterium]|nr:carbohydrate ABC transporter permease [Lachnospiraceae bacterium]
MTKTKVKTGKYTNFWERNRKSGGYLLRKTMMEYGISICRTILLFGLCFLILQPLLTKISVSFMTEGDLYDPIVISIPLHFTTENYRLAAGLMEYTKSLFNSFVVSLTIAVVQVAMCTLVGYGFARFQFPLKRFWFACVMVMILIPPQVISTSLFLHFRYFDVLGLGQLLTGSSLNLRGSKLPYYMMSFGCMGLKNGLYIYMIRQFFRNIPKEMEEAAYVDGCGTLKTFIRIMLPDAKPILTSCFLFAFVWQWTDGFYSSMFLGKVSLLSVKLKQLPDTFGGYMARITGSSSSAGVSVPYTNCMLATGTLMVIVPLVILYLYAQKGFVESLSSTGIKM